MNARMHPMLVRTIRYGLIGLGAVTLMSAVINIVGATQLMDAGDDSLGFTRREFISWFIGPGLLGIALIVFGVMWRRKR